MLTTHTPPKEYCHPFSKKAETFLNADNPFPVFILWPYVFLKFSK